MTKLPSKSNKMNLLSLGQFFSRKPQKVHINYANSKFATKQLLCSKTAKAIAGFDTVYSFAPSDIDGGFASRNSTILNQERGNGYWLWKPYFIDKVLGIIPDGTFLMYADSASIFIRSVDDLIQLTRKSKRQMLLFTLEDFHTHGKWTKRDCFVLLGMDNQYRHAPQILGGFICMIKNKQSVDFVKEWLGYATDQRIITDCPNVCGLDNFPEFIEHRHDQSILSLLGRKYELDTIPDISQWGNDRDEFRQGVGQIINLVR